MPLRWVACPRCQVRFQTDAAGTVRCAACATIFDDGAAPSTVSFFVAKNRQKVGPLSRADLERMAQGGQLQPGDMVLQEGARQWLPAGSVAGLFGLATVSPSQGAPVPPAATETVDDRNRTATYQPSSPARPAVGAAPPALPGYEVLQELGRGGMGVVYKARHIALKRIVALKMILAGGHASAADLARFLAEAQASARLQHPNIVGVYEIGEKDGLPFFSLEYVNGGTLARHLAGTPLPPRDAARLTATLAGAVHAAHQAGIVHRDLKPGNVLLAREGREEASGGRKSPEEVNSEWSHADSGGLRPPLAGLVPKIADFGLAKTLDDDSGQTRTGAIMGTPSYMSPEQAAGRTRDVGPPADIYALGAIFYEMLTGRPPFRAANVVETLEQVRSQEPVSPCSLQPGVPRDLETICLKCLAKEPQQRYGSARELADDLGRFLDNQPILARPASWPERAFKWVKRNQVLAGSAAAVFLVMLVGIVVSLGQAARARRGETEAKQKTELARQRLQEVYRKQAHSLIQRGEQAKAIEFYKAALEDDPPDAVALKLDLARAYAAIYRPEETRPILEELLRDPKVGKHEASVLLLKGYTTMGVEVDAALELIRTAVKKGLPPDEDAFARGLLADSSPEAVRYCEKALQANPYHHPSHTMLGLLLVLLGRLDEARRASAAARALYPDDPNVKVLAGVLEAIEGRRNEALRLFQGMKGQVTPRQLRTLEATVDLLTFLRTLDDPVNPAERARLLGSWEKILPDLDSIWPVAPGKVSRDPEKGAVQLLQMPPMLNKSLVELMHTLAGVGADAERNSKKLEEVLKKHPEGVLYYMYGVFLTRQGRWADARRTLLLAAEAPAIGRVRRSARALVLMCDLALIRACKNSDDALRKEAGKHLDTFLRLHEPRNEDLEMCAKLAVLTGEMYRAEELLHLLEERRLGEPLDILRMRLTSAVARNDYSRVVVLCDQVLKLQPNNAEVKTLRATALDQLDRLIRAARK